jgi:hypothetical protein
MGLEIQANALVGLVCDVDVLDTTLCDKVCQ